MTFTRGSVLTVHKFKVCSIKVTEEAHSRARAMCELIEHDYKTSCRLADRDDLASQVNGVTAEGVLSLAAVIGVNRLMRQYGGQTEGVDRDIILPDDSIAVQASEPEPLFSGSAMRSSTLGYQTQQLEVKERKINSLILELAAKRRQCDEQLKIMKRYEEINANLAARKTGTTNNDETVDRLETAIFKLTEKVKRQKTEAAVRVTSVSMKTKEKTRQLKKELEEKENKITALNQALAKEKQRKSAVPIKIETPVAAPEPVGVESIRARVLKEIRRWLVTGESGSQLIARVKTMELPQ